MPGTGRGELLCLDFVIRPRKHVAPLSRRDRAHYSHYSGIGHHRDSPKPLRLSRLSYSRGAAFFWSALHLLLSLSLSLSSSCIPLSFCAAARPASRVPRWSRLCWWPTRAYTYTRGGCGRWSGPAIAHSISRGRGRGKRTTTTASAGLARAALILRAERAS